MNSIVISGHNGFIGSSLTSRLKKFNIIGISDKKRKKEKNVTSIVKNVNKVNNTDVKHSFQTLIHLAAVSDISFCNANPKTCYEVNVNGTNKMLEIARKNDANIIFASSSHVYGNPIKLPIKENFPLSATNPYGRSKLIIENFLQDVFISDDSWHIALLRYFNPVGAHKSGLIGEDPNGVPNNLMPYISQVATGKLEKLSVFGGDYNTPDGTGVRDYIHVVDLAKGHVKALQVLENRPQILTVNLGTGKGYSVLDMIKTFKKISGMNVPYEIVGRRPGDIASCYMDSSTAEKLLGWKAELGIDEMCKDMWRWQLSNPNGYF
ncbi:MAG TPA: UDP-glucose 4-epimerase GalE [Flavobacteriales bacterium]|nr:UDP-glucose 4-epimerase GalE [Flavobacteriales bacterium]